MLTVNNLNILIQVDGITIGFVKTEIRENNLYKSNQFKPSPKNPKL